MKHDPHSFYEEGRTGAGVLLIHGLTGAPSEMRLMARHFQRMGYSVMVPLLAGHGGDIATLRRTGWRDWLDSVEEAARRFAPRVDRMHAAGICMGGSLALMASTRADSPIRSVGLYSPCFTYDGWSISRLNAFMARRVNLLRHVPFIDRLRFAESPAMGIKNPRIRARVAAMEGSGIIDCFPAHGLIQMADMGRELRTALPAIRTPTVIIHAMEDDVSSPDQAREVASRIGGPHELHFLRNSYHMIHLDSENRAVADLSARFFEARHDA